MNKVELLNVIDRKREATREVTRLERALNIALATEKQAKKQWNKRIGVLVFLTFISMVELATPSEFLNSLKWTLIFGGIAAALIYAKITKIKESKAEVINLKNHLKDEMSRPEYLEGVKNFPTKFYDYYSLDRLYHLVNEERATTLQEAFNLLETQLHIEYQNNLAERNLATAEATERSARIAAVSSVVTAFNTSRKK